MNENIKPNNHFELDDLPPDNQSAKKNQVVKIVKIVVALLILLGLAGGAYYFWQQQDGPNTSLGPVATPTPTEAVTPRPTQLAQPESDPATPVPTATPVPLPQLNQSDSALQAQIAELSDDMLQLVANEEIVRKSVRAIYGLHKGNVVQQYRPINGPNTSIQAQATNQTAIVKTQEGDVETAVFQMTDQDFSRYTIYANLARELPTSGLSEAYQYFYPLLQRAHGELGEGPEQFHTVMIGALDKLIATPEVPDSELLLIRTSIIYQFKEPSLESLPALQKLMLRMGADNREVVRQAAKDLRDALAEFAPN